MILTPSHRVGIGKNITSQVVGMSIKIDCPRHEAFGFMMSFKLESGINPLGTSSSGWNKLEP